MLARIQRSGNLPAALVGMSNGSTTLENGLAVPQTVKHRLNMGPSTSTPGIYAKEMKTYSHSQIYRQMLMATLFIIAKKRNHPNVHQLINK